MKTLRLLFVPLIALVALPGLAAEEPLLPCASAAPAATHPSLYSFADLYRLNVAGETFGDFGFAAAEAPTRVALSTAVQDAPELRFSVSAPHDGGRWALVLAGLCTCAWVAHRRLTSPY